jgi:hypothetical protein
VLLLLFFTLVTASRRALSLELSDARVYEPQIRAVVMRLKYEPASEPLPRKDLEVTVEPLE